MSSSKERNFVAVAEKFVRLLESMNAEETHGAWTEIVRAQEAIDRVALVHGPPDESSPYS